MPKTKEHLRLAALVKDHIDEISAYDIESLLRRDLGEVFSLEPARSALRTIMWVTKQLQLIEFELVPQNHVTTLLGHLQNIRTTCHNLKVFAPQNPVAISERDGFVRTLDDFSGTLFDAAAPVIAVGRSNVFTPYYEQARTAVEDLGKLTADARAEMERALQKISDIQTAVREAAREVGVSQQATHFAAQAEEHKKAAQQWLLATVVLITSTFGLAGSLFWHYLSVIVPQNLSATQSIQIAVSKLIMFSILISAVYWSARTYRANQHNYVLNKHRQNALSTFQAFATSATEEQTKNAVLLQATQCIFSPQSTGYTSQEPEGGGHTQILEIMRTAINNRS